MARLRHAHAQRPLKRLIAGMHYEIKQMARLSAILNSTDEHVA
jgi:hypothetical protein